MTTEIRSEIKEFVLANFLFWGNADSLSDTDSLLSQGILDSAGILELITFLEMRFGFTILDEEVLPANLDSIQATTHFVLRKLEADGSLPPGSQESLHSTLAEQNRLK